MAVRGDRLDSAIPPNPPGGRQAPDSASPEGRGDVHRVASSQAPVTPGRWGRLLPAFSRFQPVLDDAGVVFEGELGKPVQGEGADFEGFVAGR